MMLTPKNWHDFQHYKDRNPAWIKLHRGLLDDYEFACLPLASRALAPLLWLLASEYTDGIITASLEALAFRLRLKQRDLEDALNPLIEHGFFKSDSAPLAGRKQSASPERENIDNKKETEKESCAVEDRTNEFFNEFWKVKPDRGKHANPKATALRAYRGAVRSGVDPRQINGAARIWAVDYADKIGTEFIPMASTWLNQRRFDDYKPPPAPTVTEIQNYRRLAAKQGMDYDEKTQSFVKLVGNAS